jgi:8-oxo-dGTP pyrophosphatase MutT (NUDIX family)
MFIEGPNTSMKSMPPIVFDGAAAHAVRDAEPIDLFDAWLFAEAESSLKLQAWSSAETEDKAWGHVAYCAALDREEQAARVLADRLRPAR